MRSDVASSATRRTCAARLRAPAEPNMVVIADSTRKLLGNLFELRDLGPQGISAASPGRRVPGQRCGRVPWRAALMPCTRLS